MWFALSECNSRLKLTHFFADWAAVTHSDILPAAGRAGTKTILSLEGQPLWSPHFIVTLQVLPLVHGALFCTYNRDVATLQDQTNTSCRNIGNQLPTDAESHPWRTETSTAQRQKPRNLRELCEVRKEAEGTGHRVKTRRYGGRKGGRYGWIAENRICS